MGRPGYPLRYLEHYSLEGEAVELDSWCIAAAVGLGTTTHAVRKRAVAARGLQFRL